MYLQKTPSFLFSLYTLDLRWKMKYILLGWISAFVYWFEHFGDLLHIFCAPVCTTAPGSFTDFIFTEAAEAFYASLLMSAYSATLFTCPLAFYFFIIFFRPSLFTAESKLYQQRILGSLLFLYLTNVMVLRVLLPIIWDFWGGFAINQRKMSFLQPTLGLSPKILPYIFLVLSCFVVVFVFSQLPLLMTVFSPESGLNPENFYKRRSFWYFVLILVASFLSPPDFWLQFSIAFFLCSLFECLVLLTFCTALYKDTGSFA